MKTMYSGQVFYTLKELAVMLNAKSVQAGRYGIFVKYDAVDNLGGK